MQNGVEAIIVSLYMSDYVTFMMAFVNILLISNKTDFYLTDFKESFMTSKFSKMALLSIK